VERASALHGWLVRFAIVYAVVYMLPFPVSLAGHLFRIPAVAENEWIAEQLSSVLGAHGEVTQSVIAWVGDMVFGIEDMSFAPNGSGDRTENYLDLVVDLVFALVRRPWYSAGRAPSRATTSRQRC